MQHDYLSSSSLIHVGSFSALLKREQEAKLEGNHLQLDDYFGEDSHIASMEFYEMESVSNNSSEEKEEEEEDEGKRVSNTFKHISTAMRHVSFQPYVAEYEWQDEEQAKPKVLSRIGSVLFHAATHFLLPFNKWERCPPPPTSILRLQSHNNNKRAHSM